MLYSLHVFVSAVFELHKCLYDVLNMATCFILILKGFDSRISLGGLIMAILLIFNTQWPF